jgi:pyruvate carboxylase
MAETRKHSWIAKETDSDTHGAIEFNGEAEAAGRVHVTIEVNPTIQTEDHTLTITNS